MRLRFKNEWRMRTGDSWGWWFIAFAFEYTRGSEYGKLPNAREFHFTICNFDFYIEWGDRTPTYGMPTE